MIMRARDLERNMQAILGLLTVLLLPLVLLNTFGGLVAGVWLAFLGEWKLIGIGFGVVIVGTGFLKIAMSLGALLADSALVCAQEEKSAGMIVSLALSIAYIMVLMSVWCCGVLYFCMRNSLDSPLIPRLLWSYVMALGPWVFMASQENRDDSPDGGLVSILPTFFLELAYVTIMIVILCSSISLIGALQLFACFMSVALLLQVTTATLLHRGRRLDG